MNCSTRIAFALMLTLALTAQAMEARVVIVRPPAREAAAPPPAGEAEEAKKAGEGKKDNRPDEQFLRQQRMQRDNARNLNSGVVDAGEAKLSDLLQLKLEGDLLELETGAGSGARSERYQLKGADAYVVITRTTSTPMVMANGVVRPSATSVSVSRIDRKVTDDETLWTSSISRSSTYLSMSGRSVLGQISFSQSNRVNLGAKAAPPTRMTIYEWQGGAGGPRQQSVFTATANTVDELRTQHPAEFRKYLVPLFRKFSDMDWMVPGATDAYGVFEKIRPDEDAINQLQELLPELDSDAFEVRQAAGRRLMDLGPPGVLAALRMDAELLSDEQKGQLGRLIAAHRRRHIADPSKARTDPGFLTDCLEHPDQQVREAAIQSLEELVKKKLPFDPALQGEALTTAADEVRKQVQELVPATQPATEAVPEPAPPARPAIFRERILVR